MPPTTRFPIRYTLLKGLVLRAVGVPARAAYVEIGVTKVRVRLGWVFHAAFDRSRVESSHRSRSVRMSAGAHGWRGRWLVNGASGPIVSIRLNGPVRAWVAGYPVRLREVAVSIADPEELMAAL